MRKAFLLIGAFILALISTITISFAWFLDSDNFNVDIEGLSMEAYYAGGVGSKDNPYIISEPRHLYNFAWLQDLGAYDKEVKYFQLGKDIDMSVFNQTVGALPAVGIDGSGMNEAGSHPFKGNFDGNGKTISNLIIANSGFKKTPSNVHLDTFDFGSSIGFFGVVTSQSTADEEIGVSNFVLDRVEIKTTQASTIGLVCGQAKGNLFNIGIGYSKLSSTANLASSSDYGVIGSIDEGINNGLVGGDLYIDIHDMVQNHLDIISGNSFIAKKGAGEKPIVAVPGAIPGTAYYSGNVKYTNSRKFQTLLPTKYSKGADGILTKNVGDSFNMTGSYNASLMFSQLIYNKALSYMNGGISVMRQDSGMPTASSYNTTAQGLQIPQEGFYFKAQSSSDCELLAQPNSASSAEAFALYKITRNTDQTIQSLDVVQRFEMESDKDNNACFYFSYPCEKDVEYMFGQVENGLRPKFYYFTLPLGDQGFDGSVEKIEFVDPDSAVQLPGRDGYESVPVYFNVQMSSALIYFRRYDVTVYYYATGDVSVVATTPASSAQEEAQDKTAWSA